MIADLKPYAEYKESGLPWLGPVPGHWEVRRLRHACEMRVSNVDKHTKAGETPVRLCNYVDVYKNERITQSTRFMAATATEDERLRFSVRLGDVLITKDSEQWNDIGVPALVEHEAPDLVCGYHLAILRPRFGLRGPFLHRALESHFIAAQFHVEANGVTRYGLSHGAILGVAIPLPPPDEQAAIVRFLDWASGRLERAIRAKRKVIALLNEQKQAIIHRAVTRGLDPSVPLKDSGVPWLGEIPKHWEVLSLKRVLRRLIDCEHKTAPQVDDSEFRVVRTTAVRNGALRIYGTYCTSSDAFLAWTRRGLPEPGDVIFTREAPAGEACEVPDGINVCLGQRTVLMKPNKQRLSPQFLIHMIYTGPPRIGIILASQGSTVGHFNMEDIGALTIVLPPKREQDLIVAAIAEVTAQPHATASRLEREITLLREYRTRLVADVVTGKLDVRAAAASLPDEAPLDDATASPDPDDALDTGGLTDAEADDR